jgi:hypothetical protein
MSVRHRPSQAKHTERRRRTQVSKPPCMRIRSGLAFATLSGSMNLQPVVLEGTHVRLDPLTLEHQAAFYEASRE